MNATSPKPWRYEQDWTHEVLDANGDTVAKCRVADDAHLIIESVNGQADAPDRWAYDAASQWASEKGHEIAQYVQSGAENLQNAAIKGAAENPVAHPCECIAFGHAVEHLVYELLMEAAGHVTAEKATHPRSAPPAQEDVT